MKILENERVKLVRSKDYNYNFDKKTGYFERYGKTKDEDPIMAPTCEILDLEISAGKCMGMCPECYKGNGDVDFETNMTLEGFANILHKVAKTRYAVHFKEKDCPSIYGNVTEEFCQRGCRTKEDVKKEVLKMFIKTDNIERIDIYNEGLLQQVAFGICNIGTNKDFFNMMEYAREFDVIPNYTCHGLDMSEEYAQKTAKLCGAVAVSVYNKDKSYNAVKMLHDAGMKQINFHVIAHDKSYKRIISIIDDLTTDERIKGKVKAVVMLKYKPKGNGVGKFNHLTDEQYKNIISYAEKNNIGIGFDSCSACSYLRAIKDDPDFKQKAIYAEPCESGLFSAYINCKGEFYACSFCENEGMWKSGIDVLNCNDFVKDVWNHPKTQQFREVLLKNGRKCPMYNLD